MKDITIGFIGLGLIGGSIAKTLHRVHPEIKLVAYNRSTEKSELALKEGIISEIAYDVDDTFSQCDYIFLCTPVEQNNTYLSLLKDIIKDTCIITDVGSVKSPIHKVVKSLNMEKNFIGGHPMTGSEKTGYANGTDRLLENAYYIITTSEGTNMDMVPKFQQLVTDLGSISLILDYNEHDKVVAAISHMPHLIASGLVNVVKDSDGENGTMKLIAAGGFKDITRIASSSPEMWEQICTSNSESISIMLERFINYMTDVKAYVDNKDGKRINEMFATSKDYRDSFSDRSHGPIKKVPRIYVDIADEKGAIATISAILAFKNFSIKNIGIVHNREFEEGVLRIELEHEDDTDKAAETLRSYNYSVTYRK
jgi:prephenate dehydrogenase